ncbi:hypothetical protein ABIB40_003352 [Pedobacter sp. UYP30]
MLQAYILRNWLNGRVYCCTTHERYKRLRIKRGSCYTFSFVMLAANVYELVMAGDLMNF